MKIIQIFTNPGFPFYGAWEAGAGNRRVIFGYLGATTHWSRNKPEEVQRRIIILAARSRLLPMLLPSPKKFKKKNPKMKKKGFNFQSTEYLIAKRKFGKKKSRPLDGCF